MTRLRNSRALVVSVAVVFIGFIGIFTTLYSGAGSGYFHGGSFHGDNNGQGNKVLHNGVPDSINNKASFISYIKGLYDGNSGDYNDCSSLSANTAARIHIKNDCIGAAYIIQTMRGGTDRNFPSSNDIVDWVARINNPAVIYENSYSATETVNTRIGYTSKNSFNPYDVFQFNESVTREASIRFKFLNSRGGYDDYVIKRACGNPLGNPTGLPTGTKDYNLSPNIILSASMIEAGSSFNVTPSVANSGTTTSDTATYKLIKTITNPSASGATTNGSGTFAAKSTNNVLGYTETSTDYPPGSQICYVLSVTPHSNTDSGTISSSPPVCVTIGKRPKVQVWGGDLMVGGAVATSSSKIGNNTFGSWVEYAIFAKGVITSPTSGTIIASGSAFAGGGQANSTAALASKLSFANSGNKLNCTGTADPNTIGCYTIPSALNIAASFPGGAAPTDATGIPNNWPSGTYSVAGNITLNSSTLSPGKSVIIKSNGTVTIADNQKYSDGPYTKIKDLPQLVIIANNINIADNVTQIDAWLVASGNLNTCASVGGASLSVSASLSAGMCNNQLTVTGPVVVNKIYLRRTAGSDNKATVGSYAEKFNLRADAYLWAYSRVSGNGRIQTIHTTELPPRL